MSQVCFLSSVGLAENRYKSFNQLPPGRFFFETKFPKDEPKVSNSFESFNLIPIVQSSLVKNFENCRYYEFWTNGFLTRTRTKSNFGCQTIMIKMRCLSPVLFRKLHVESLPSTNFRKAIRCQYPLLVFPPSTGWKGNDNAHGTKIHTLKITRIASSDRIAARLVSNSRQEWQKR